MKHPGILLTFEGVEACGKSTQVALLQKRLTEIGYPAVVVKEPGATPMGEEIRRLILHGPERDPWTELLLFCASRNEMVQRVVKPALAEGKIVISDRYIDSSIAYQGYGLDLPVNRVLDLCEQSTGGITPVLTFLLEIPEEEMIRRRKERGGTDKIEERGPDFFSRVRMGFKAQALQHPNRCRVFDACVSKEALLERIWEVLLPILIYSGFFSVVKRTYP